FRSASRLQEVGILSQLSASAIYFKVVTKKWLFWDFGKGRCNFLLFILGRRTDIDHVYLDLRLRCLLRDSDSRTGQQKQDFANHQPILAGTCFTPVSSLPGVIFPLHASDTSLAI